MDGSIGTYFLLDKKTEMKISIWQFVFADAALYWLLTLITLDEPLTRNANSPESNEINQGVTGNKLFI